jgi:glycosyltransferase involved in cell wall biosynthesis
VKVVYVCTVPSAGPVAHLLTLAPAVAAEGVSVRVVCAREQLREAFEDRGVPAAVAPVRHKFDVQSVRRLLPLLRDADLVHTHDRRAGLLVRPPARARGMHVVHTYHGLPEELAIRVGRSDDAWWPGMTRARMAWLRYGYLGIEAALARLGTTVVPSHAMARYLIENGLPAERIRVIHNAIDVRRTEPDPSHEPFVLGTAAVLLYRKGIDVLIDACARLTSPVRLEIFGGGELQERLSAQAERLGVAAVFHGEVADVRERLMELDAFVLPARGENFPIALLEAMAAAVPVVATRVGGVPELVEDGVSGLLVPPDRPDALAQAIDRLAGDEGLRVALGRAGARRVTESFDAADAGRRMVRLYAELCGER